MSQPIRKDSSGNSNYRSPTSEIRPVTTPLPKKPTEDNATKILVVFASLVLVVMVGLAALSLYRPSHMDLSLKTFETLDAIYLKEGIGKFTVEKQALKRRLATILKEEDRSDSYNEAANIAVYLFPDILPSGHMEKETAMNLWGPLQESIESAPRTTESRQKFEELRANIWNYENPDRKAPQLTATAKQVIRIYEVLSSP